eukprot:scaffold21663_cov118-Isochrysis_galbana.AAC.1
MPTGTKMDTGTPRPNGARTRAKRTYFHSLIHARRRPPHAQPCPPPSLSRPPPALHARSAPATRCALAACQRLLRPE